jgi:hypothetical protein
MAEAPEVQRPISKNTPVTVAVLVLLVGLSFASGVTYMKVEANGNTTDELRDDMSDLPTVYVPRTEVEAKLDNIDDSLERIQQDLADIEAAVKG